jgi:hypothetical protein
MRDIFFSVYYVSISVRGVAQSGSASGLGPEGREFESLHPDHIFQVIFAIP